MIGIYKIINPKGRIYIGQTIDFNRRYREYSIINKSLSSQIKLYRSLNKHGFNNHIIEFIEECEESQLNNRERYWQEFYDVVKSGLNCKYQHCDSKSGKLSDEIKIKIGNSNKNKIRTQEQKDNISKKLKGLKQSQETIDKRRNTIMNKPREFFKRYALKKRGENNPNAKKVICTETGKIWNTITDCANDIDIRMKLLSRYLNNVHPNKTTIIYLKDYEKNRS